MHHSLVNVCAFSFMYLYAQSMPFPFHTWESGVYTVGMVLGTAFFAGQLWKDWKSSKGKLANDHDEINALRREIHDLKLANALLVASVEKLNKLDSSHRRLRDKFYLLLGALSPVLKDMDADFTRGGTMGRIMAGIDDDPSTDDGVRG